jgi:hypothetical protein
MNNKLRLYVLDKEHDYECCLIYDIDILIDETCKLWYWVSDDEYIHYVRLGDVPIIQEFNRTIPGTKYQDYEFWRVEY